MMEDYNNRSEAVIETNPPAVPKRGRLFLVFGNGDALWALATALEPMTKFNVPLIAV